MGRGAIWLGKRSLGCMLAARTLLYPAAGGGITTRAGRLSLTQQPPNILGYSRLDQSVADKRRFG